MQNDAEGRTAHANGGTVYNFCPPRRSLARGQTPATAGGITDHVWSMDGLLHYRGCPRARATAEEMERRTKAVEALIARWAA